MVSRAYERTSLIVTTNLPFENWTEVLGSERLTGAMLDRLTHRVHILEANGRELPAQGRQKTPQTLLSRQPEIKGRSTAGGRELEAHSPPPARFISQSKLSGSNLTT